MTAENYKRKQWRYDTAIEALQELIEQDQEENLNELIKKFKYRRSAAHDEYMRNRQINEMQVEDFKIISNN